MCESTKQAEKPVNPRWEWVESTVWNANMLRALDEGVKGGKWFSLIDKVYRRANLDSAFASVKRNGGAPGIDSVSVSRYEQEYEHYQETLQRELQNGQYRPKPLRRKYVLLSKTEISGFYRQSFSLKNTTPGIYFVQILSDETTTYQKVVVQ